MAKPVYPNKVSREFRPCVLEGIRSPVGNGNKVLDTEEEARVAISVCKYRNEKLRKILAGYGYEVRSRADLLLAEMINLAINADIRLCTSNPQNEANQLDEIKRLCACVKPGFFTLMKETGGSINKGSIIIAFQEAIKIVPEIGKADDRNRAILYIIKAMQDAGFTDIEITAFFKEPNVKFDPFAEMSVNMCIATVATENNSISEQIRQLCICDIPKFKLKNEFRIGKVYLKKAFEKALSLIPKISDELERKELLLHIDMSMQAQGFSELEVKDFFEAHGFKYQMSKK